MFTHGFEEHFHIEIGGVKIHQQSFIDETVECDVNFNKLVLRIIKHLNTSLNIKLNFGQNLCINI